jgi:hypothetical protein
MHVYIYSAAPAALITSAAAFTAAITIAHVQ